MREESSYPAPGSPTNSYSRSLSPKPSVASPRSRMKMTSSASEPSATTPPQPKELDQLEVNNGRSRAQNPRTRGGTNAERGRGGSVAANDPAHCPEADSSRNDPRAQTKKQPRDPQRGVETRSGSPQPRTRGVTKKGEKRTNISIDGDGRISFDKTKELDTAAIRLEQLHAASSWDFDPDREEWIERDVMIYFPPGRSTPGGIRVCEKLILVMDKYGALRAIVDRVQNNPKRYKHLNYYYTGCSALYVAKSYKTAQPAKIHYDELLITAVADAYCQKFNKMATKVKAGGKSQKVGILPVTVMRVNETGQFYNIEPFLPGKYQKFNDNFSYVHPSTHFADSAKNADMDRKKRRRILRSQQFSQLAQAFSHFTYHVSKGKCIVVDIQGVGTYYTDAQIHTHDGRGFGLGNLGLRGIGAFRDSHICAKACRALRLPPIGERSHFVEPGRDRSSRSTGHRALPPRQELGPAAHTQDTHHIVIGGQPFQVINGVQAAGDVMRECLEKAALERQMHSPSLQDPMDEAFNLNEALDEIGGRRPKKQDPSNRANEPFNHLRGNPLWAAGSKSKKSIVCDAEIKRMEEAEQGQLQKRKRQQNESILNYGRAKIQCHYRDPS